MRKSMKGVHTDGSDFWTVQIPLTVLSFFSIFGGLLFKDLIVGPGYFITLNAYSEFIFLGNINNFIEYVPTTVKVGLLLVSLSGFLFYGLKYLKPKIVENTISLIVAILFVFASKLNISEGRVVLMLQRLQWEVNSFFFHRWYFDTLVSYFLNRIVMFGSEEVNVSVLQTRIVDNLTTELVIDCVNETKEITREGVQTPLSYIKSTYLAIILTLILAILIDDVLVIYDI